MSLAITYFSDQRFRLRAETFGHSGSVCAHITTAPTVYFSDCLFRYAVVFLTTYALTSFQDEPRQVVRANIWMTWVSTRSFTLWFVRIWNSNSYLKANQSQNTTLPFDVLHM